MRLMHVGASRSVGLPLPNISAFTRVFDALWGEGGGEGVTGGRSFICSIMAALACSLLVTASAGSLACADEYPSKPIHFILPQPAGGAVDLIARSLGDRLSEQMRQPVIIENQPGANGGLAASQVTRATPDGHTLFMAGGTHLGGQPRPSSPLPPTP